MKLASFWRVADFFVPADATEEDPRRRAQLLIGSSLLAAVCFAVFAVLMSAEEARRTDVVAGAVGALLFLSIPWVLRASRSLRVATHGLAAIALGSFAFTALRNGGLGEPATYTASLVPFIVAVTVGWRAALPWAVAVSLGTAALYGLHQGGHTFPESPSPEIRRLGELYGTVLMTTFLCAAAAVYDWLRVASLERLEQRNRELQTAHEEQTALGHILELALEDAPLECVLRSFLDEVLAVPWLRVEGQGAVFLTDGAGSLALTAERGLAKPLLRICERVPFGRCLCGRAAASGCTQFASCVDARHEHRFEGMSPHGHYNVPIVHGDTVLGVFVIYLEAGRERDEREVLFLESAARIAASVILRFEQSREARHMQSQLLQAQKLESIGQLAAGVAHEINTPSQYVGDNLEFLEQSFGELGEVIAHYQALLSAAAAGEVPPELVAKVSAAVEATDIEFLQEEIPRALAQSRDGVGRISKIVRAMKEFSHPGSEEKEPVDLNRAIESTVTVARNEWKYVAELELDLDPELPAVPALAAEFNQVVLNIVVNAAHAIAELHGGDRENAQKGHIHIRSARDGDGHVLVEISDDGPGIPDDVRARIFDPFFTTKDVGKGTGQGLAIARSVVVDKHHGSLDVRSQPGNGTTFSIRLPLDDAARGEMNARA